MIIGVSGHRPQKFGINKLPHPMFNALMRKTSKIFLDKNPSKIITGMCIGYDQWVAQLAIKHKIPFVAAIPFVGQELLWTQEQQKIYRDLLSQAEHIEIVNPGGFASWKMQARNKWIVDNSDWLVAAFAGHKGGTYNCIEYAKECNKKITIINS